ncbi:Uncharacterized conserved protein [Acholeplasma hippikon]|uniref:Uncharacterized conserved protein n=1 Tax=Acholeplasma hippikon TaxID=264636 RepID=A0A449BJ08_9MOLU|nr:Uncharacterized conserved protein [Acholeplasma hippikon]
MIDYISSLDETLQNKAFKTSDHDKNIRDVLAHLYEWHQLLFTAYKVGCVEMKIPILPKKGYTWNELNRLNQDIWEMYQDVSLREIKERLNQSHYETLLIVEKLSEAEPFNKGVFTWTGDSTLAHYIMEHLSLHYEWALNKIKNLLNENK